MTMEPNLETIDAFLRHTPAALDALLRGLPSFWTSQNEGGESWSPLEVVGHLIHGERTDWIPRARRILESGEERAFDPFDRLGLKREIEGKSLAALLDEFAHVRSRSLEALRAMNLREADFDRRGHHPSLGIVTLGQLLATWAAHDLTHLHQISRTMAHQLRGAVGPWTQFLGVLQCAGHSS